MEKNRIMDYKETLNLPQTEFPMRANLAQREPETLARWEGMGLHRRMAENRIGSPTFVLHDGPPYANGHIHIGHALNKILKDIIVKFKSMQGFYSPYVPGWDCHGLPIELQVDKNLGEKKDKVDILEKRKLCREYAEKFVDIQREEFKRLGVMGDWAEPYLTMSYGYEGTIVREFAEFVKKDYVYKGKKPVHWCPSCVTALAEAEVEYADKESLSVFVKFGVKSSEFREKMPSISGKNVFFIIWTTTPWTLPANLALAFHPELVYAAVEQGDEVYIVAEGRLDALKERIDLNGKVLAKISGKDLEGINAEHPFIRRKSRAVLGEFVSLEEGTGIVHIAPGHGEDDYETGLKYGLDIYAPVDDRGKFTKAVPELEGQFVFKANTVIIEILKNKNALMKEEKITHSYPHCWRCKKPVIFRATEQWFISVEHNNMREKALNAVAETKWIPSWGENRIRGMINTRPDWCISRQRSWGVPIPAFYCTKCKKVHFGGKYNKAVQELAKKEGTDGWFKKEAKEILPQGIKCECGNSEFSKETDILDVWFESGSSHAAVLETRLSWPADLYLEGSDQHRGWFQSSLLTSVGVKGKAPFKSVLTHGFTIDDKGKKMSKSLGNVIDPLDVIKKYGADVLRLWVASTDFRNDMAASDKILKQVQDAYLKIRNTCRFLISNLSDFEKPLALDNSEEIDKWILTKLNELIKKINSAYEQYELHIVYHALYDFCVTDLSAHYLDMSKDRLYCDKKDSKNRKSAQTAINEILITLLRLMAPILSFTAEDIYRYYKKCTVESVQWKVESVFLLDLPRDKKEFENLASKEEWEKLFEIREKVYKKIEEARSEKKIASSVSAMVLILAKDKELKLLLSYKKTLEIFFIVSKVEIKEGDFDVAISPAPGEKCERCWQVKESVGQNNEHATLCERCVETVKLLN